MGIVDFVIDLTAVLSASRSVASKHVALRARQLDRYAAAAASKGQQRRGRDYAAHAPERAVEEHGNGGKDEASVTAAGGATEPAKTDRIDGVRVQINEPPDPEVRPPGGVGIAQSHHPFERGPEHASSESFLSSQGSEARVAAQQPRGATSSPLLPPQDPATQSPTLRELRLQREREEKDKAQALGYSEPVENQGKAAEEAIPEGVNLEGLFRTSRASGLSPLWKDAKKRESVKQPAPERINSGIFRTSRGSSVLKELKNRSEASSPFASRIVQASKLENLPETTETVEEFVPPEPMKEARPGTETEERATTSEAEDRVKECELAQSPESATQEPNVHAAGQENKPASKEDAYALGEVVSAAAATPTYDLRESKVPSSRLGRIWNYSGLAAGMFAGAVSESFSRVTGGGGQGSLMLSPANMERLVVKLSKMRGAALKLGQMMSFQDSKMLPAPIQEVLQRVQDRADYMPSWQRDRVLATNLGAEWRDLFDEFEEKPIAAASIGQVHRATLKSNGARVAVKIQFPGVADSINSDLDNLGILLAATKLLPKGLYLNKTIDNARTELSWECDYEREASCAQRYRDLLASEKDVFLVPRIYPEACGKQVLTMEFMDGVGVTRIKSFTQEQRDWIGTQILRLCLREIAEFRFMQTDPNWTNFLYNAERDRLVLLDFGASREYPDRFITLYVQLLAAASRADRDTVRDRSEKLGYLTGHESKAMLDAHVMSILTLAEPFMESAPEVYDFRDQTITERVKAQIPVMIRERLAPPPEETYSLHRKLSGAFLLCARLGSRVRCKEMLEKSLERSGMLERQV